MNRVIIRGEALLALIPDMHEVKSLRRSSIVSAPTTLLDIRPCLVVVATLQCSQTNSFIRSFFCSLARPRVSSSFFLSTYRRTTIEFYERILCIGSDGIYDSIYESKVACIEAVDGRLRRNRREKEAKRTKKKKKLDRNIKLESKNRWSQSLIKLTKS